MVPSFNSSRRKEISSLDEEGGKNALEEGNQLPQGQKWFLGQQRRMGFCFAEHKLREIECHAISWLLAK